MNCFKLLIDTPVIADKRALRKEGNRRVINMPITAKTMSNSKRVNLL